MCVCGNNPLFNFHIIPLRVPYSWRGYYFILDMVCIDILTNYYINYYYPNIGGIYL